MSGEADDVRRTGSAEQFAWAGPQFNYRGRRCLTCRELLRLHERKYHKGLCALAGKTAKQARRRATLRQRAAASRPRSRRTIG